MSGEGFELDDTAEDACDRISETATTDPSDVPLVIAIVRLVSGGIVMRSACGSTIQANVAANPSPVLRAASHCPRGTACSPA